jgi:hypothetical protein
MDVISRNGAKNRNLQSTIFSFHFIAVFGLLNVDKKTCFWPKNIQKPVQTAFSAQKKPPAM